MMPQPGFARVLAALALVLAACGSSTGKAPDAGARSDAPADGSGTSAQQACMDLAVAECNKRATCSDNFGISRVFGTPAVCEMRLAAECVASLAATGTAATPQSREACASDLATADYSCTDLFDNSPTAACTPPMGSLANGMACGAAAQCASTWCAIGKDEVCGTCQPLPAVGASCTVDGDCGRGLACAVPAGMTSGTCAAYVAANGACLTGKNPCAAGLSCVGENVAAGTTGTCQPAGSTVGATCDSTRKTMPGCEAALGLACIPSGAGMTTGTCQAIMLVGSNQTCGLIGTPTTAVAECSGGGLCVKAMSTSRTGTCVAPAADGAACDSVAGPPCLAPARCVPTTAGSTAGTCVVPNATMCH